MRRASGERAAGTSALANRAEGQLVGEPKGYWWESQSVKSRSFAKESTAHSAVQRLWSKKVDGPVISRELAKSFSWGLQGSSEVSNSINIPDTALFIEFLQVMHAL